jgi:hypothetical protein
MLRLAGALFLAPLLVAQACGGSDAAVAEIERTESVPVDLSVTMKGDLDVTFRETVTSHFIVRRTNNKDEQAQNSQVVGTEPTAPIKYGNAAFLAGVGIMPYRGDGTYTIPVGSPLDAVQESQRTGQQAKLTSSIKVEWWPTGDVMTGAESFMRRAKPCKVVVKNLGTQGTVTCPDVTNETQDKHFSLTIRWVAPVKPSPTTSTSLP